MKPIYPDWPAPANVKALLTTREGGASLPPWDEFNVAAHVGDDPQHVAENRRQLAKLLPAEPQWLNQMHGSHVAILDHPCCRDADASVSRSQNKVCAVLTADCLPVLFCNRAGTVVAAAHAGWRGLAGGILEKTVAAMNVDPGSLIAWMGPAIGPDHFEVGNEVKDIFTAIHPENGHAFAAASAGKWLADIYSLARMSLAQAGVHDVYGGNFCTYRETEKFFSYRRDGVTGRMASLVWMRA